MKPLDGTFAENALAHGVAGLNIDGARISGEAWTRSTPYKDDIRGGKLHAAKPEKTYEVGPQEGNSLGRWPANVLLDEEAAAMLDEQSGESGQRAGVLNRNGNRQMDGWGLSAKSTGIVHGDFGGASRFFYTAKAGADERPVLFDSTEIVTVTCPAWDDADQKATLLVDTAQSPPKVIDASGAGNTDASAWSTWLFGNPITARSLAASKFTIRTRIRSTTASKTLNWLVRLPTSESIADANGGETNGGSRAGSAARSTPYLTITVAPTAYPPGAGNVPSGMLWTISGSAAKPVSHPTVKPLSLLKYLCTLTASPTGGEILDPFGGSMTTLVAAREMGRPAVAVEIDEAHCRIGVKRLAQGVLFGAGSGGKAEKAT